MIRLINRSAHDTGLPAESVHMIATSPPYWGLRAYAGEQGVTWPAVYYAPMPGLDPVHVPAMRCDLGLEPTPEAYIGHLILVMREMWRVLREDGTCWVNLGDSYARQAGDDSRKNSDSGMKTGRTGKSELLFKSGSNTPPAGLKPKDLCMIPARFALAAQADGWWVRSDIIWAKPNPMPESVTDRPTKAHEYIYLLSKSERYYYDHVAVREGLADASWGRMERKQNLMDRTGTGTLGKQIENGVDPEHGYAGLAMGRNGKTGYNPQGRNRRTVWTVATRPYSGAHFATWPPDLVRPMIRAGTSARGVCSECGAPWERETERTAMQIRTSDKGQAKHDNGLRTSTSGTMIKPPTTTTTTTGWAATCPHADLDPIPATVLDPFSGSGTTGMVAIEEGREYIGVDISQEYLDTLAPDRLTAQIGLRL